MSTYITSNIRPKNLPPQFYIMFGVIKFKNTIPRYSFVVHVCHHMIWRTSLRQHLATVRDVEKIIRSFCRGFIQKRIRKVHGQELAAIVHLKAPARRFAFSSLSNITAPAGLCVCDGVCRAVWEVLMISTSEMTVPSQQWEDMRWQTGQEITAKSFCFLYKRGKRRHLVHELTSVVILHIACWFIIWLKLVCNSGHLLFSFSHSVYVIDGWLFPDESDDEFPMNDSLFTKFTNIQLRWLVRNVTHVIQYSWFNEINCIFIPLYSHGHTFFYSTVLKMNLP